MARTAGLFTIRIAAILTLIGIAQTAPAAQGEPLTIMLHVDDYAAVPTKMLLRAESRVNTVYTLARYRHALGEPGDAAGTTQ